nr:MAG TPA: hypothetical protein [Caudoviricetes sp.]
MERVHFLTEKIQNSGRALSPAFWWDQGLAASPENGT